MNLKDIYTRLLPCGKSGCSVGIGNYGRNSKLIYTEVMVDVETCQNKEVLFYSVLTLQKGV